MWKMIKNQRKRQQNSNIPSIKVNDSIYTFCQVKTEIIAVTLALINVHSQIKTKQKTVNKINDHHTNLQNTRTLTHTQELLRQPYLHNLISKSYKIKHVSVQTENLKVGPLSDSDS